MAYRITIELVADGLEEPSRKVYEQTLPEIDLPKLIAAINARPRKRREKKGG